MGRFRKLCAEILVVLLLLSTIVAKADDNTKSSDVWTYMGITFNTQADEDATINSIKEKLDAIVMFDSYFKGIDADTFIKKMSHNEEFKQCFVSVNPELFTAESQAYIKSKYTVFDFAEKNYDWYTAQTNSGKYSNINCGFAAISMILEYFYPNNNKTTQDLRNESLLTGKLDMLQVSNILTQNNITPKSFSKDSGIYNLTDKVDYGAELGVLAVDTGFYTNGEKTGAYHALILNGHFIYEGKDYYTVYNPSSTASFTQARIKTNTEICAIYKNIRIIDKDAINKYGIWIVTAKGIETDNA